MADQIHTLVAKIKQLIRELRHVITLSSLKKLLGATALGLLLSVSNETFAQSFAPPQLNPFGLVSLNTYISAPAFADLDGDGDADLLVGEDYGDMYYFENIGSATNPIFATPQLNPFGLIPDNYAFPAFADLDGDSDFDLLVNDGIPDSLGGTGFMLFFENTGSQLNPQFAAPQVNPFGLDSTISFALPVFVDLDNDGDLDLLVGENYGILQYFENTGSPTNPQFAAPLTNPFGLTSTYNVAAPAFADLDRDGDMDLLVGEYYYGMQYFENTGTVSNPQFASPQLNPFGLTSTYYFSLPAFADLDDDGDMDLLVGEYYGGLQYFENTSAPDSACDIQQIALNSGWNIISSYIVPDDPDISDVFTDIEADVILVKNKMGSTFIPSLGINTIGNWQVEQGYKVKASNDQTLIMGCQQVDPTTTPISLPLGWCIMAYLRSTPMDIAIALNNVSSNILIVKSGNGGSYIPSLGISTIGAMLPGQGFKIKMSNPDTLYYPGN